MRWCTVKLERTFNLYDVSFIYMLWDAVLICSDCLYVIFSQLLISARAVPEFGSGSVSGRNPAFFANPADIRLRPKLGRISAGAGFGKLSLNNTNLNYL